MRKKITKLKIGDSFLDELTLQSVLEIVAPLLESDIDKAVYDGQSVETHFGQIGR